MNHLTIFLTKLIKALLKLMGHGGSMPGRVALKLNKTILKNLTYPNKVILVSGTNGKTTTNNMVARVMQKKYDKVIWNERGDNLMPGITTLVLTNTGFNLKVKADCMVIEVDELNVPHVLKNVKVDTILINNFFRDQLDRAGEMETIVSKVSNAIKDFKGQLVINGDDPNVARLGEGKDNVYYFGVNKCSESKSKSNEASEGKFCFRCNTPLKYEYYQYSHIGRFTCPNCGFGNYQYYLKADDIDLKGNEFSIDNFRFHAPQDALYSIYNCVGVISVAKLNNIAFEDVKAVLDKFELKDGRMETFNIGRECLLNLVKNPTGANEVMKYINRDESNKDIVIVLNDNDQDGTDVSWIWDANFDIIINDKSKNIICSGKRAYDMALRMKYSSYQGNLIVKEDLDEAIKELKKHQNHAYVISTYTALQNMRAVLRRHSS